MSLNCPTPNCDRVMPGHLRVCRACSADLLRDLADVPSLDTHLEIAIARQSRMGDRDAGARSTETALPWDQRAREAANILRSALVGWHRVLAEDAQAVQGPICPSCEHPSCEWIDLGRTPADTLTSLARRLLRHRTRLLAHQAAAEAVDELTDAVHQARLIIDRPADKIYAGPCNQCERDLYARPGSPVVDCGPCKLRYDVQVRREWMLTHAEEMIGTSVWVANVATGLGFKVSPSTVRMWAKRGRLGVRTYAPSLNADREPHPLYRVGDVIDLVVRQRARLGTS